MQEEKERNRNGMGNEQRRHLFFVSIVQHFA